MGVSIEMARLVVPWKGSGLVKNRFLGVFSSVHLQHTRRSSAICFPRNSYFTYNHHNYNLNVKNEGFYWRRSLLPSFSPKLSGKRLASLVETAPLPAHSEELKMDAPKEIFLKDYNMPDYLFDTVDLKFVLGEEKTIVFSKIAVFPRVAGISSPLVLHGSELKLLSIKINGKKLEKQDFQLDHRHLTLLSLPVSAFTLEIETEMYPQKNTSLEGLYKSSGNFCTQCEAEGFRKITFYQDRLDVMARYTCRIEADKSLYPVLLSNGNLIEQGDLEMGLSSNETASLVEGPDAIYRLLRKSKNEVVPENKDDGDSDEDEEDDDEQDGEDQEEDDGAEDDPSGDENAEGMCNMLQK